MNTASLLSDIITSTEREARSQRAKAAWARRKAARIKDEEFNHQFTGYICALAYTIRTGDVPADKPGGQRMIDLRKMENNARGLAKLLRNYRLGK